ncbi:MAG TPA: hypothetical protein VEL76_05150 [Gemmataceae bacterium]|nr:hypothetical protein [Gemmataceae bacterium]
MFKFLFDFKRLLLLGLCVPFGLVGYDEVSRLVKDRVVGVDLSSIPPPKLKEQLDTLQMVELTTNRKLIALGICLSGAPELPSKASAQEKQLSDALKPRAARLRDVKLFFREYAELKNLTRLADFAKRKSPFDAEHPFYSEMENLTQLTRQEVELEQLAAQSDDSVKDAVKQLKAWRAKLKEYTDTNGRYVNRTFAKLQKAKLTDAQLRFDYRPKELFGQLEKAVRAKTEEDARQLLDKLNEALEKLKKALPELSEEDTAPEEINELRQTWQRWQADWEYSRNLLVQRVAADRLLKSGGDASVRMLLTKLGQLAEDRRHAEFKRLVVDLAHDFCQRYLPEELPLDPFVQVWDVKDWLTVRRDTIKIVWRAKESPTELKDEAAQKKFTEFNQDTWTREAKSLTVNKVLGYEPPKLLWTDCGKARDDYNGLRGNAKLWRWARDFLEKTRNSLKGVQQHLNAGECWARLNTLADAFPEALE